ncbi:MAG: polysaccharide biosynthesis tyrosine autokinase [Gemmataceae bacterium]
MSSAKPTLGFERADTRADFATYLKTQAARIKSRDVLMKAMNTDAVRNLRLVQKHPDTLSALTWLEENMKIEVQDGSELMEVGVFGEDPDELVVLVNALTKSYLSIIGSYEKSVKKDRVSKMKMLYEQAKDKLGEMVAAREAILAGSGVKDATAMASKQAFLLGQKNKVEDQLAMVTHDLLRLDLQLQALEASRKKAEVYKLPDAAVKELQESDPLLRQDLVLLRGIQKTLDRLEAEGHPPGDFTVLQMKANTARTRKRIDDRTKELIADYELRVKTRGDTDHAVVKERLMIDKIPLDSRKAELEKSLARLEKETDVVNTQTAKKQLLDAEIAQAEHNVAELDKARTSLIVAEEAESRVAPVGEAEYQKLASKKRILLIIMAPFLGLVLVSLAVAWRESSARRITSVEEVAQGLSLRVVGTVPVLPQGDKTAGAEPGHHLVESIDAIRTMLLRSARNDLTRVVLVTSAVSGEGKTTLASNLAVSLAKVGKKTLLMDCDLRGPAVHQLFEQQLQPGFSEAILGEVPLPDTLRQTPDPNLWVLPAGHWDREVIQELAKNGLESIFERLKEEFDFILVDSHPILAANDALLIAQQVDAVILSLMSELSQAADVYYDCQKLAALGIDVFGTVINAVPAKDFNKNKYSAQPQTVSA